MQNLIRHVGIVVHDLEKSLEFWCHFLGFKIFKEANEFGEHLDSIMGLKNVDVKTVKLIDYKRNMIELLYFRSHPDLPTWRGRPYSTGITHIALTVENLDSLLEKLYSVGSTSFSEPVFSKDGLVRLIYLRSPDGVILELVEEIKN